MMRIAVVTPLFPTNAEPYRGNFISQTVLALRGWAEVELFYPHARFPRWSVFHPRKFLYSRMDPRYSLPGVPLEYIEYPAFPLLSRPFNGKSCARRLLPYLKKSRPDLILAYWLYPEGFGALLVGEKLGIPVILGARGSDLRVIPDPITARMIKSALRRASYTLTVSEELRKRVIETGVSGESVQTILNGCDSAIFQHTLKYLIPHILALR